MNTNALALRASALLLTFATISQAGAASVPNRVLVKLREGASNRLLADDGTLIMRSARVLGAATPLYRMRHGLAVVRYSSDLTPKEAAELLATDPQVEYAQPDYIMSLPTAVVEEEVEFASGLTSLTDFVASVMADPRPVPAPQMPAPTPDARIGETWGLDKIQASAAWKLNPGHRKVLVADIDTGIDYTHEDLVNNLWEGIGYDFINNDALPFDDHMHGTHTAGTIGATGFNGKGVAGVSPAVSIMGLKFISAEGSGTTSDAVRAIDYAIEKGARVMSNSWGGPAEDASENKVLEDAVERANQADILFVAAAGNDATDNDTRPMYPAAIQKPNVLAVASTSPQDKLSVFSNFGRTTVHVGAPGSGILSTTPGNEYRAISGTSMACPHVAGLAALILAERPELTAVQVKQIIMETVDSLPTLQGRVVTGGRINAFAAIKRAKEFVAR